MPDPFNLRTLDDDTLKITPLPAQEIRRRGDRRRNTRRVGVATVAVAAVGALALTVSNLDLEPQPGIDIAATPSPTPTESATQDASLTPDPTQDPTDGASPPSSPTQNPTITGAPVPGLPAPGWSNVPLPEDLAEHFPGIDISVGDEYEDWRWEPHTICAIDVEALDATTVLIREFNDELGDSYTKSTTLGFATPGEATAAIEAINDAYANCVPSEPQGGERVLIFQEPTEVPPAPTVLEAAEGWDPVRASSAVSVVVPEDSDIGLISTSDVVQVGNRLTWLVSEFEGQDHNCLPEADPVVGMEQCPGSAAMETVGLRLVG